MRARMIVMVGLLLAPTAVSAQRLPLPRIGGRGPAQPVPLSPQPEAIARALAYRRLNLSVETYPLISVIQASGLTVDGRSSPWTAVGVGTRASYRLTPHVAATLDLTSSFLGSPVHVQTAELGTRLGPERSERRLYPFVDLRAGYMSASSANLASIVDGYGTTLARGMYYNEGFGGIAGAGMEYALTRTFSLTTGASVLRGRLRAHQLTSSGPVTPSLALTSYRFILGVRYNPVRLVMP